jgi:UDP-glucose 4-epimerase
MSRVLITGVNGFIGRRLAYALSKQGHSVVGVSLETQPNRLPTTAEYHKLDLVQHSAVEGFLDSNRFDALIHLAALVHVRDANLGFDDYSRVNYRASETLFESAAKAGINRIVFASTVEVYGPQPEGAVVNETTRCNPDSDYGRTKLLAEEALERIAAQMPISYSILRFAPVYAPDFRLNLDKRIYLKAPQVGYHFGKGQSRLCLCSIRNIEYWTERWLASPTPPSGTFNLADEYCPTAREILLLERKHSRAKTIIPLPLLPCLTTLAFREVALSIVGSDPGMYTTANIRKLERSTTYDASRANLAIGSLPGNVTIDLYEEVSP